jgi:hypothetical protein
MALPSWQRIRAARVQAKEVGVRIRQPFAGCPCLPPNRNAQDDGRFVHGDDAEAEPTISYRLTDADRRTLQTKLDGTQVRMAAVDLRTSWKLTSAGGDFTNA